MLGEESDEGNIARMHRAQDQALPTVAYPPARRNLWRKNPKDLEVARLNCDVDEALVEWERFLRIGDLEKPGHRLNRLNSRTNGRRKRQLDGEYIGTEGIAAVQPAAACRVAVGVECFGEEVEAERLSVLERIDGSRLEGRLVELLGLEEAEGHLCADRLRSSDLGR